MATDFTIEFHADDALEALKKFPGRTARATSRALNRSLTTGQAVLARLIAADMGMKVVRVKRAILERKSTATTLEVRLGASLHRLPIAELDARQTRAGVSYKDGAGRKTIPGAFLATVRGPLPSGVESGGHKGVFRRSVDAGGGTRRGPAPNRSQLPIKQLFGASIGHVFLKHKAAGVTAMREAFDTNLAHELEFYARDPFGGYYGA